MTIQNPVGGSPEDPYEKYRKYQIEGVDNQSQEGRKKKFDGGPPPPKKPLPPGAFLLILLSKILDYFLSLRGHGIKSETAIRENLILLKEAFESMQSEDRSQDIEFLNHFSEIWHLVLENSTKFRRIDPFPTAFRSFMKKIQNYPEGQEHTLGYYLTEYTGQKWLPFPYMDLIQKIHEEYQSKDGESPLALWIQMLDELISSLNPS
jgi:hypothetical protein